MQMRTAKPYGPAYVELAARVARENGCGVAAMGALYFIATKMDWEKGTMPHQLAHKTLAAALNIKDYKTAQKAITQLKRAGVIADQSRGNSYDGGDANIYRYALPPTQNLGRGANTPTQKTGSPPPKKWADPYPKNGQVNPHSSLSRGENDPARRGAGPDDAKGVGPVAPWDGVEPYGNYLDRVRASEREALRAAENG